VKDLTLLVIQIFRLSHTLARGVEFLLLIPQSEEAKSHRPNQQLQERAFSTLNLEPLVPQSVA